MSPRRVVPLSLALGALLGAVEARAQYREPWTGAGITARQETGHNQVLVAARPAPNPAAGGQPAAVERGCAAAFTVRVENLSRGEALSLSDGRRAPFVIAPVLWVIHTGRNPIFTGGRPDAGKGLEQLAEEGNPEPLAAALRHEPAVVAVGVAATPAGARADGPLTPGTAYEFGLTAEPGQFLSLAAMFGQSNDWFYANDRPIALFDAGGRPVGGDLTPQIALFDAGTEVDEEPGLGPNQAPRQKAPNQGAPEREGIARAGGRFAYPRTADVFRLTITPRAGAVSAR